MKTFKHSWTFEDKNNFCKADICNYDHPKNTFETHCKAANMSCSQIGGYRLSAVGMNKVHCTEMQGAQ